MLTSLLAGFLLGASGTEPEPKLWFMFFLKGDGARPSDLKELEKLQADHIKNLQTQGAAGHLVAAGPLSDPTQLRRGITVAVAKDRGEIDSFFTADPFVKSSIMTVSAASWEPQIGRFSKDYDKQAMAEYELTITTQSLLRSTRYALRRFAVGGRTDFVSSEKYRFSGEVWISMKSDHEKLVAALDGVAAPREILPLWMAKGLLRPTD